ncbi:hypothetical protein LWI28_003941 [Acer negundo]|uniref:O-fucosyltransferase family protein n=1 Tax=Acer negundo TaxID=4023 RepID=A0AAD5NL81_ACENE|nr:hypothetical protein LWI28_003941 [Acer negundo]
MDLGVGLNNVQSECKKVGSVFECDIGNTSSSLCSKEEHPNKDIKELPISEGLITILVEWVSNDKVFINSKRMSVKDFCLAVKKHGMKTRSAKYKMLWILDEEISKVIDMEERSYHTRGFSIRPSFFTIITLCIILLSSCSIFIFLVSTRNISDDDDDHQKDRLVEHFNSHSQSQSQSNFQSGSQSLPVPDELLWDAPFSYGLHPCVKPTSKYKAAQGSDRYITVRSNGGLNQMRTGISDMVAVAYIMNATLVIPQLDKRSFWQDSSTFSDILMSSISSHHYKET